MKRWLKFLLAGVALAGLAALVYTAHFFWSLRGLGNW